MKQESNISENSFLMILFNVEVITKGLNTDEKNSENCHIKNSYLYKLGSSNFLVLACWLFSLDGSQRFSS